MKRFLFILAAISFLSSCKKEDEPDSFDFNISAIDKIEARVEETKTIRLLITCNRKSPEKVLLTLEDVPSGINYKFDKTAGTPEFTSNLVINISRTVAGGLHTLKLVGSSSTIIKEVPIEINIDKSLSAVFTVYNSTTFDLQNINSNLVDSALVKLYKNQESFISGLPDYKEYTDKSGKARFYKLPVGNYLYTIDKEQLSNVVQKRLIEGVMKGYVVAGLFRTQEEIINSAQPKAKPGDLKFRDINADNKIDASDLGQYDNLSIYNEEMNEKVIWLGN